MAQASSRVGPSIVRVVLFWWVASLFWVSLSDKRMETLVANSLAVMGWINVHLPTRVALWLPWNTPTGQEIATAQHVVPLTFGHAVVVHGNVAAQTVLVWLLTSWTVFMLVFVALAGAAGLGLGIGIGWHAVKYPGRHGRVKGVQWNGVACSIGPLEKPAWNLTERAPVVLTNNDLKNWLEDFKSKYPKHAALVESILGIIFAHDAFAGEGHDKLAAHTEHVIWQAVSGQDVKTLDPLIVVLAASHDLGKVITHGKGRRADNSRGYHDTLGMRILSGIPELAALAFDEREIVLLLTGFAHKVSERPALKNNTPENEQRLQAVRHALHAADRQATAEEQKAQRESPAFVDVMQTAFLQALRASLKDGKPTCVHAHDRRKTQNVWYLRISETKFSPLLEQALGEDAVAAGGDYRRKVKGGMTGVTRTLFAWLEKSQWLEKSLYGVPSKFGLYDVVAGDKDLNGVYFVKVTPELLALLREHKLTPIAEAPRMYTLVYVQDHHLTYADLPNGELKPPQIGCEPNAEPQREGIAKDRLAKLLARAPQDKAQAAAEQAQEELDAQEKSGEREASPGHAAEPSAAGAPSAVGLAEADIPKDFSSLVESGLSPTELTRAVTMRLKSRKPAMPPLQLQLVAAEKIADILKAREERRQLAKDDGKPPVIVEPTEVTARPKAPPKPKQRPNGAPLGGAFMA